LLRFLESLGLVGGCVVGVGVIVRVLVGLGNGAGGFEGVTFGSREGEAED
jgi:hypothetical protein